MSLKPVEAFEVYCDGCGKRFECDDYTFFMDVEEWVDNSEWKRAGDRHLCEDCYWSFATVVEALWEATQPQEVK